MNFAQPPRSRGHEVARFGVVGGAAYFVDLATFNFLLFLIIPDWPMLAKVVAVAVAMTFSWLVNRNWTFVDRATTRPKQEFLSFALVNLLGMAPPLLCLWISHYLLGFTSPLADNISANIMGLIAGTVLRYFGYRHLVFTGKGGK